MGAIIYWKKYDEPRKYYDPIRKKKMEMTGEYICEDKRVGKFWMFGCMSAIPSEGAKLKAAMLMMDGSRWESKGIEIITDPDKDNAQSATDNLISQAEQYLKSLSINKCISNEFPDHDYQKIIPE